MNEYTITIAFDEEAKAWYAQNDDIPIILEDISLDTLINRVKLAAPEMLEPNNKPHAGIGLLFTMDMDKEKKFIKKLISEKDIKEALKICCGSKDLNGKKEFLNSIRTPFNSFVIDKIINDLLKEKGIEPPIKSI